VTKISILVVRIDQMLKFDAQIAAICLLSPPRLMSHSPCYNDRNCYIIAVVIIHYHLDYEIFTTGFSTRAKIHGNLK